MVSRLALITAVRSLTISNISRTVRCLLMLVMGFSASGSRREAADIVPPVKDADGAIQSLNSQDRTQDDGRDVEEVSQAPRTRSRVKRNVSSELVVRGRQANERGVRASPYTLRSSTRKK